MVPDQTERRKRRAFGLVNKTVGSGRADGRLLSGYRHETLQL
jgi:hypothetical protein